MKVSCVNCSNVFYSEDEYCPRCDSDRWKKYDPSSQCWAVVYLKDGGRITMRLTASLNVGGYLAKRLGETGALYMWNESESRAIPRENILQWRLTGEEPD